MKPIPEALEVYFPTKVHPDRPWWLYRWRDEGVATVFTFERPDGYGTDALSDREKIDRAHPMQPPPILVGQVWALVYPGNCLRVGQVQAVEYDDGEVLATLTLHTEDVPGYWLRRDGYLLTCPFGYAPWSGPEVL